MSSALAALWCAMLPATAASLPESPRFGDVIELSGEQLEPLWGRPLSEIGVLACAADGCHPIPMQIDERDATGAWVLDRGLQSGEDTPPRQLDGDDVLLFMAADAGESQAPDALFDADQVVEVIATDPLSGVRRFAYVIAAKPAPRSAERYVAYDPITDRFSGARVSMGFGEAVPTYLSVHGPAGGDDVNVLDRLKVRAAASLFWGLLRFHRDESDLTTELAGWHEGPIRVIRHQRQRVRLGWGIRSPTFRSYTYFYRDYAVLPVGLRLNFPPTYFFSDISIEVVLDFRDLRGWRLYVPGEPQVVIGRGDLAMRRALNDTAVTTFALVGPEIALVQSFSVSPSLATVRKRLIYRDGPEADPPEAVPGSYPGVGYGLREWEEVGAGEHGLTAVSYAVPLEVDLDAFLRSREVSLAIETRVLGDEGRVPH